MGKALLGVVVLALLVGQTPSAQDEAIWQQFETWVAALPALAPGDSVPFRDRYLASLVQQGVARKEAERRYVRMLRFAPVPTTVAAASVVSRAIH